MNISVIIPVYNAENFLEKAVKSVLQFEEIKEVLLCEDKSQDNSLEICYKLMAKDNRVKLFQHTDKGNHGAGATRNLGLENATQEFVAFLDADDYYLPNRFDAEKKFFKNSEIDGIFNAIGTEFISEKGRNEFREKFGETTITTVKKHTEGKQVFYGLLGLHNDFGTFFHLNGLTVKNDILKVYHLKFNPDLKVHQDSDFIIKLSYHCHLKSGNIENAVAMRGVHDDNRITKIKLYSPSYNARQFMLWDSVHKWASDKNIQPIYKQHILLQRNAFKAANLTGINKLLFVIRSIITKPNILKTRYRFTYLNR